MADFENLGCPKLLGQASFENFELFGLGVVNFENLGFPWLGQANFEKKMALEWLILKFLALLGAWTGQI